MRKQTLTLCWPGDAKQEHGAHRTAGSGPPLAESVPLGTNLDRSAKIHCTKTIKNKLQYSIVVLVGVTIFLVQYNYTE